MERGVGLPWRGAARKAREQVRWTCESDERRELGRAAGETLLYDGN
jgi:hypothetical protein